MIESLIAILKQELDLTAEEITDILWLTLIRQQFTSRLASASESALPLEPKIVDVVDDSTVEFPPPPVSPQPVREAGLFPRQSQSTSQATPELKALPFKVPNPASIRNPLALARSLRPLNQRVPSKYDATLDENKTAQKIAEERVWQPVTKPILEPWLDLALVVDESTSMLIWRQTVLELQKLLKNCGAFRDVRTWGLLTDENNKIGIRPGFGTVVKKQLRLPEELIDPSGRRLILVITDCVSSIWQTGKILPTLQVWTEESPMALIQMLPEWMWVRTALKQGSMAHFYGLSPGVSNQQLSVIRRLSLEESEANARKKEVRMPVFALEPTMILAWSKMVAGIGNVQVPGYIFRLDRQLSIMPPKLVEQAAQAQPIPEQQVQRFRVASSPMARRLAGLLAASPIVSLPVIRLIQETLLRKSRQVNVAEVLLGGILKPKKMPEPGKNPDEVEYDFIAPKIRSLLLESAPVPHTVSILSAYINKQFKKSLDEFIAELRVWTQSEDKAVVELKRPFAIVTAEVLKRQGGRYAEFVREIEQQFGSVGLDTTDVFNNFPKLQTSKFEFEVATITISNETETPPDIEKQPYLSIHRHQQQGQCFIEDLGNGVWLEMVAISEGSFLMGSLEDEPQRLTSEIPQHTVTIKPFFLGKYPVTQAQWQVVASLSQVNRELETDPSDFKGANRPVEKVSWYDAVEFCLRLSQYTGKPYRLPSEAEWEYACRAGTTTPFHFGETITSELANYKANYTYGAGVKGDYREQTTPVGSFGVANAFGLYDMHGNVWEWCLDDWHDNYKGAPIDGNPWFDNNDNIYQKQGRTVLRGGSWFSVPELCRSAYRNYNIRAGRDVSNYGNGFRVACRVEGIIQ